LDSIEILEGINHCYVTREWIVTRLTNDIGLNIGQVKYAKVLLETREYIVPARSTRYFMSLEDARVLRDALTLALEAEA